LAVRSAQKDGERSGRVIFGAQLSSRSGGLAFENLRYLDHTVGESGDEVDHWGRLIECPRVDAFVVIPVQRDSRSELTLILRFESLDDTGRNLSCLTTENNGDGHGCGRSIRELLTRVRENVRTKVIDAFEKEIGAECQREEARNTAAELRIYISSFTSLAQPTSCFCPRSWLDQSISTRR
jgi:hypothetical protein